MGLAHAPYWDPTKEGPPKAILSQEERAKVESFMQRARQPSPAHSIQEDGRRVGTAKGNSALLGMNISEVYTTEIMPLERQKIIAGSKKGEKITATMHGAREGTPEAEPWTQGRWHGQW
jgi:hypothetical protein